MRSRLNRQYHSNFQAMVSSLELKERFFIKKLFRKGAKEKLLVPIVTPSMHGFNSSEIFHLNKTFWNQAMHFCHFMSANEEKDLSVVMDLLLIDFFIPSTTFSSHSMKKEYSS